MDSKRKIERLEKAQTYKEESLEKRFTKNVELEKEQAAIEARMRIAREKKGNSFDEVQAFLDHEMLMEENTNSGITLGVTHNTGDRNRCEGVFL